MNTTVVHCKNLRFKYPSKFAQPEKWILDLPELKIEKGEKLFLFGTSGSGKSTLLEILSGILSASSGQVEILGKDLAKLSATERDQFRSRHVGYIFQSFNLIPYLSIQENILLPAELSGRKKSETESRMKMLTEHLGISQLLDRRVTDLSVGQQQRVAVARALLLKPEIILADEPTSALDFEHREKFLEILFKECEAQNTSLVFVSHDLSLQKMFSRSVSLKEINQAVL